MSTDTPKSNKAPVDVKWPPFNPFLRHPTRRLAKLKMVLAGSVLVPIRLVGVLSTLFLGWLWATLGTLGSDPTKPYSPRRLTWIMGGCRILARVLLFFCGYVWIHETYETHKPSDDPDEEQEQEQKHPPASIVVCNHVGFVELLYLAYRDGCCFVSKESNRRLPGLGNIAEAMQSIFIRPRRGDGGGRDKGNSGVTGEILERARSSPGRWPPLAICPEGTTTTGHVMIRFRTGAFLVSLPVQPVAVQIPFSPFHGYDPSFCCCTSIAWHMLCLMSQPMNYLHVTRLPLYVPNDAEKSDPQLFANNVRKKIADTLDLPTYELEYMHKCQFETTKAKRALGRKLLAEQHCGVPPAPPVFTRDAFGNALEGAKDK